MSKLKTIAAAALLFAACTGEKRDDTKVVIETFDHLPGIDEAHGTIGEGTSMNVLEFVGDEGDTLYVDMSSQSVVGGERAGDEVQLVYATTDTTCHAIIAVNLTSLQHLWSQTGADGNEQSLELNSGGRATTYNMSIDYDSWSVSNGTLLLHSPRKVGDEGKAIVDTFDIMELTDETLVLSNGVLTTEFRCDN